MNSGRSQALLRFQAVDALIDKESLVSAEILEEDAEKFYWLGDYGFRPTRKIKAFGRSLIKMELSTVVFFQHLKEHKPAKPYRKKKESSLNR